MPSSGETDKLPACSTVLKAISEAFMYGFCLKVPFSPQFQAVLCLKDFMLLCLHSSNVKVSLYCKLFSHTHFNPELFLVYTRVSAAVGLDIKCVFNLPAWCQIASMCDWGQGFLGGRVEELEPVIFLPPAYSTPGSWLALITSHRAVPVVRTQPNLIVLIFSGIPV